MRNFMILLSNLQVLYPVMPLPQQEPKEDTKQLQQIIPIYQPYIIDYMFFVKLGNIVLSAFMLIWMVLLLLGNWSTYMSFIKNPTVGSVVYFGFGIIVMLSCIGMVMLSLVIQFFPTQLKTSCTLIGILLTGTIVILVWSFKMLAIGINLSIILTFFYPVAVGAVSFYILTVIQSQS
jgi:hypothetical protein